MQKTRSLIVIFLVSLMVLSACAGAQVKPSRIDTSAYRADPDKTVFAQPAGWQTNAVKNVILMIGDGMGINHIWLTQIVVAGPGGRLNIERLPVSGLVTTYSASNLATDSAAAATALATGRKTANGVIGCLPDGARLENLIEKAEERRMATGLVVTKAVTDATPAGFSAHNASRGDQTAIAADIFSRKIEVIFGGGLKYWRPQAFGGVRTDGRDLVAEAEGQGYRFITGAQDLAALQTAPALGLFAAGAMDEDKQKPSLADMTGKAVELLGRDSGGFFLLVEGSQIDTGAHVHDYSTSVRRVLDFDAAVRAAVEFARKDGHTLVLVTADHETGGLVVLDGLKEPNIKWSSFSHSSSPVAIFAYGPGAYNFTGLLDNTQIPAIIARLLGFESFPKERNP